VKKNSVGWSEVFLHYFIVSPMPLPGALHRRSADIGVVRLILDREIELAARCAHALIDGGGETVALGVGEYIGEDR
jgi:hypothetical protein